MAVVVFDGALRILDANRCALDLLEPGDCIDEVLAKGTDRDIWQGWSGQLKDALSTGQTCTFDQVGYTAKGRTRQLRIFCTPVGSGPTGGGMLVIEDVTDSASTQQQLAEAERLAAVGRLAAKVAHELNNPLDGILRYINLAMRIVEEQNLDKPREYLLQCRKGIMRMVQIVSELLEFSRSTYASMEYTSIEHLIEESLKTVEGRAETLGVRIVRRYDRDLPELRAGNLFQVFCNLARNALDAMPGGGELQISTRLDGHEAVIEFRDTGKGIDVENPDALFEPFFTTKPRGEGTGLGLAICRDIVESHHGKIAAENAPDGGSVFTVRLPIGRIGAP